MEILTDFYFADQNNSAKIYVDTLREEVSYGDGHEYCGLKIIADTFAEDVGLVTGNSANVVTERVGDVRKRYYSRNCGT